MSGITARRSRGAVVGRYADATVTGEHLAQLCAETVMEPGVQERVAAGRAHAHR